MVVLAFHVCHKCIHSNELHTPVLSSHGGSEANSFGAFSAVLPIIPQEQLPILFPAVPVLCFRVRGGVELIQTHRRNEFWVFALPKLYSLLVLFVKVRLCVGT